MTTDETYRLLSAMSGVQQLMAKLIYGSGLRLMECIRLRVKDIDFGLSQVVVRIGKGNKDRVTVLPINLQNLLRNQLEYTKRLHEGDLDMGLGIVYLPHALTRYQAGRHGRQIHAIRRPLEHGSRSFMGRIDRSSFQNCGADDAKRST